MFSNPQKILEQFDVAPSMKVADFGSGVGYYTFQLARMVGSSGHVFALDIHKEQLITLKREALKAHLSNVDVIWADFERPNGTKLKACAIERGIIANVFFQIGKKDEFAKEVARVIRPDGLVLVVDWTDSFGGIGPSSDSVFSSEKCKKLFEKAGFVLERAVEAGSHHYGLIFRKRG